MTIKLPDELVPAVQYVEGVNDEEFDQVLAAVPRLAGKRNVAIFADEIAQSTVMSRSVAVQIAKLVGGLRVVIDNSDQSPDEVISEVLMADRIRDFNEPRMERLAQRLRTLVEHPSVGIFASARDLILNRERVYSEAQVALEVTPVIQSEEVAAMMVLHSLRIDYQSGGKQKSLHVTLDHEDLMSLAGVAVEAANREAMTVGLLEAAGYQITSHSSR